MKRLCVKKLARSINIVGDALKIGERNWQARLPVIRFKRRPAKEMCELLTANVNVDRLLGVAPSKRKSKTACAKRGCLGEAAP